MAAVSWHVKLGFLGELVNKFHGTVDGAIRRTGNEC